MLSIAPKPGNTQSISTASSADSETIHSTESTAEQTFDPKTLACRSLSFVQEGFFGANPKVRAAAIKKAEAADAVFKNDRGETVYCNSRDVLQAVRQVLRAGEDHETTAQIFAQAFYHGYQTELCMIVEECWPDFFPSTFMSLEDGLRGKALVAELRKIGLVIPVNQPDRTIAVRDRVRTSGDEESRGIALNALRELGLPDVIGAGLICQYMEPSFEEVVPDTILASRPPDGPDFATERAFFKDKFERRVIDSDYLRNLTYSILFRICTVLNGQGDKVDVLEKFGSDFFLTFGEVGLDLLTDSDHICQLLLRGDISVDDLKAIDQIAQRHGMEEISELARVCDLSNPVSIKTWISEFE